MIGYIAAFCVGGMVGVFVMALCAAAGNADRNLKREE